MTFSLLLFSSVTAFADTTVDTPNYTKEYFSNIHNDYNFSFDDNILSSLPPDDYLVIYNLSGYYLSGEQLNIYFVPRSLKKYAFIPNINSISELIRYVNNNKNDNLIYIGYNSNSAFLCITSDIYKISVQKGQTATFSSFNSLDGYIWQLYYNQSSTISYIYDTFINDSVLFNNLSDLIGYKSKEILTSPDTFYRTLTNVDSLFSTIVQLIPGYTGGIYDSTLEHIIEKNGKPCDDTIIDSYKYQIYYSLNNDLRYVFLNNAYQPKYTKDKIQGTNSEIAYKYKFTYQKSSDCIVYFPTFQMYLPYDDWYSFQPKDNDFKWFWEDQTDNKSFNLFSDWTYENGNYIGSRVSLSWEQNNQLGENADFISLSQFITDKDKLLNNGWIEGRPSDTSYPYCIEVDYNGQVGLFIYSNSKPTISKIDIQSDNYKKFEIYMVGMYGYVYNAINDVYINYDFTIKDGQKNIVQQYLFKYFSYQLHCLDNDLNLTLYENYKGTDTDYKGTRVFFNWDITQDKRIGVSDEQMQKLEENCKEDIGGFLDENGNNHGGNLNNYTDEDKNKFNESGSNSSNTIDNSFDFTFDGIINYCDEFFRFIESVFGLFPSFIWVLVGASIAVLIALRVIGR